jgi:Icc-related predicted phosphoesterase
MRIVHFSDWHGDMFWLPPADLYVCTGDMLPNFRTHLFEVAGKGTVEWVEHMELLGTTVQPRPSGRSIKILPHPEREAELQSRYLERQGRGYLRKLMSDSLAPVVCCRGNHDFVDLSSMFSGGPVFEISHDPIRISAWHYREGPMKIGGVRGVNRHHGRWSDELTHEEFADRVARLPSDIEILVTHAPPEGILDTFESESIGSSALRSYVARHDPSLTPLKAHFFGHVHESRGTLTIGTTVFSNASRGSQIIDL